MQFMQEQFQQMQNESELAFNQIKLIKEQLNIEIGARLDSQVSHAVFDFVSNDSFSYCRRRMLNYFNEIENY